jgi:ribulose-phosphate 3-epimerase
MLSADFTKTGDELIRVDNAGADAIHWDIMDGSFTDSISFGHLTVARHRELSRLRFDVQLMTENPEKYIENFARAGADVIIVHAETCRRLHRTLGDIKLLGKKAGVALNPATPPDVVHYCADVADLILVMTVNPGSSGQNFIKSQLNKISDLRNFLPSQTEICVDGGITDLTVGECAERGADSFVSGSYIFKNQNYADAIKELRQKCNNSLIF